MAEDDERYVLTFDKIEEFLCARAKLAFVVVCWPCFTVESEKALHHDGVNREKHGTSLGQAHQYRLMSGSVAASFEQSEARQDFDVAVNQAVTQNRLIPMNACGSKTGMSVAR